MKTHKETGVGSFFAHMQACKLKGFCSFQGTSQKQKVSGSKDEEACGDINLTL